MSDKKYIVSVVGVMKKNGVMAHAGEEVVADNFDNFDERVKGGYVKEKAEYEKEKAQSDEDQLKASEQKDREDLVIAYKKAFKVDAPASASTSAIKKAIANESAIADKEPEADKKESDDKKEIKKLI